MIVLIFRGNVKSLRKKNIKINFNENKLGVNIQYSCLSIKNFNSVLRVFNNMYVLFYFFVRVKCDVSLGNRVYRINLMEISNE